MSKCKLYIGDHLYPIGFPVVLVTTDSPMPAVRMTEFFILLFPPEGRVQFNRRRFIYRNVPDNILGDEDLLNGTLETVRAELDLMIHRTRTQLNDTCGTILPYSMRFTLQDLSSMHLRFLLIQHNLSQLTQQINRETYSDELKGLLPSWPSVNRWEVEVDQELAEPPPTT